MRTSPWPPVQRPPARDPGTRLHAPERRLKFAPACAILLPFSLVRPRLQAGYPLFELGCVENPREGIEKASEFGCFAWGQLAIGHRLHQRRSGELRIGRGAQLGQGEGYRPLLPRRQMRSRQRRRATRSPAFASSMALRVRASASPSSRASIANVVLWRAPFGLPGLPGLKRLPRRWAASSSRAVTAIPDVTGAGLEPDMGILPTGTGLDRARRLTWLVQPRCGCSLRLAGGR